MAPLSGERPAPAAGQPKRPLPLLPQALVLVPLVVSFTAVLKLLLLGHKLQAPMHPLRCARRGAARAGGCGALAPPASAQLAGL